MISFAELKSATRGFNRALVIGEGGFGSVYRGVVRVSDDDHDEENDCKRDVAIKQLNRNGFQGHKEWLKRNRGYIRYLALAPSLSSLRFRESDWNDNIAYFSRKVVVSTKSPKSDKQYVWEAAADSSSYVIREETDPEKVLSRGTEIVLYLRPDDKYEFSEPTKIQELVKKYSQFVSFPIYTWKEKSRTVEQHNRKLLVDMVRQQFKKHSEWSVAQFRLREGYHYIVAFGHQKNTVIISL